MYILVHSFQKYDALPFCFWGQIKKRDEKACILLTNKKLTKTLIQTTKKLNVSKFGKEYSRLKNL